MNTNHASVRRSPCMEKGKYLLVSLLWNNCGGLQSVKYNFLETSCPGSTYTRACVYRRGLPSVYLRFDKCPNEKTIAHSFLSSFCNDNLSGVYVPLDVVLSNLSRRYVSLLIDSCKTRLSSPHGEFVCRNLGSLGEFITLTCRLSPSLLPITTFEQIKNENTGIT